MSTQIRWRLPWSKQISVSRPLSVRVWQAMAAAICLAGALLLGGTVVAHAQEPDAATANPLFAQTALDGPAQNVAVDSEGRTWFTLPTVDKLAYINSAGLVVYYPVSDGGVPSGSAPYDLAIDGNTVWFTLLNYNNIGKLDTTTGDFTFYPIPTADSKPTGISLGGGYVWFVERAGDKLGRLNPDNGNIVEFYNWVVDSRNLVDMRGAQLEDVAWSEDGVWITGPTFKNSVALYRIGQNRFVPSAAGVGAAPMQIVVDSAGGVWVTFSGLNMIGQSSVNTLGLWTFHPLPNGQGGPVGLFVRDNGGRRELWYTRPDLNRAGYVLVNTSGRTLSVWESPLPSANSAPWGIAVGPDNKVWIAASGKANAIAWNSPYFPLFLDMPVISYFPPQ